MKLSQLGEEIKRIQDGGKLAVVTDSNVAPVYLTKCLQSLRSSGFDARGFVVPAGEENKNGGAYLALLDKFAGAGLTREDGVVALGGGMVGDLAGFAAATFMRGIRLYQVPTTLLAMVDSSIGGKTGIDLAAGKNLAGAFHMPALVFRDAEFLRTLPAEVMKEGLAEVVKYGVISDEGLFSDVEAAVSRNDIEGVLPELIERCAAIKTDFVQEDPFDTGVRNKLNFGHTVGHALEKLSGYSLPHGFAVAKGMEYVTGLSVRKGWCDSETYERLHALLSDMGYDLTAGYSGKEIMEVALSDKKRTGDRIRLITPDRIGSCTVREVSTADLMEIEG